MQQKRQHGPKQKFQKERVAGDNFGFKQIKLTPKQKHLGHLIQNNTLIFVEGPAGSGKSLGVLHEFVRQYLIDFTKDLVIVRTPVEAGGDKIGFLPNDLDDKIAPHFSSTRKVLEDLLDPGKVECDLGKRIKFLVPNYVLGSTLDNSLILIDECFTEKHELLTPTGWKNVKDIQTEDKVWQHNEDGTGEFVKPLRVIHKPYEGDIVEYKKKNLEYSVTQNHRMVYTNSEKELTIKLAKDSSATNWNFISTSLTRKEDFPISDSEICIAVAIQADGSCQKRGENVSWQIQLSKKRKIDAFNFLNLDTGNFFHQVKDNNKKLRWYSGNWSSKILNSHKEFNFETIMQFSQRQLNVFVAEVVKWDGHTTDIGSEMYCTTVKHNADVVQAAAHLAGLSANVSIAEDVRKESYKDIYRVFISTEVNPTTQKHDINKVTGHYQGNVHCVTVPSGMVLTRCGRSVHVSGNCQQMQPLILKLLMERIGKNSVCVVCGDRRQLYTSDKNRNGLTDAMNRFFRADAKGNQIPRYEEVAHMAFSVDDVVRSDIVKTVIKAYSDLV